ncbi:putative type II secretory pathway, component PulD, partial [Vibrio parahaemolyticus VPTS-2010]
RENHECAGVTRF